MKRIRMLQSAWVALCVMVLIPAQAALAQDGTGQDITRADFADRIPLALIMTVITLAWIAFVIVMAMRTNRRDNAEAAAKGEG